MIKNIFKGEKIIKLRNFFQLIQHFFNINYLEKTFQFQMVFFGEWMIIFLLFLNLLIS